MNNKGFTLVEVLTVIAILSIVSGVAVAGVSKYLSQSKRQAYGSMEKSAKEAAIGYAINNNIDQTSRISLRDLVDEGYLDEPIDPNKKGKSCADEDSYVEISLDKDGDGDHLASYQAKLHLQCPSGYHFFEEE